MGLRPWLDPPEAHERKRLIRAGVIPRPDGLTVPEIGVPVPFACMVPLVIAAAVLVGAGVLLGVRYQTATAPDRVTVRVIDDRAQGGPRVLSTQVVPLR